jgi:cytochrome c peroxidase
MSRSVLFGIAISVLGSGCVDDQAEPEAAPVDQRNVEQQLSIGLGDGQVWNLNGVAGMYSPLDSYEELHATNAFFANLGTSGRTCESCHGLAGGFTTSMADEDWVFSGGTAPLFQFTFDTGVCSSSDISTYSKRLAAMKLTVERGSTRGLQRVQPTAEFEIVSVADPYNCADNTLTQFNGYRKPNPLTGVSQKSSVTWAPGPQPDMRATLKALFVGATNLHGQATTPPGVELQENATDFMLQNYFAQQIDFIAGRLDDDGARGGPRYLSEQEWHLGINHASTGATTRKVFNIYDAWIGADRRGPWWNQLQAKRRALIAEGQELFNFRVNANGGTCSGCHNSPNVGTRSVYQLFDIGAVDIADTGLVRATLRNKTTNEIRVVTNLGRAAATGLWSDIGKMAVPPLRGLSSRAPFFNSGQAKTLRDVVNHYNTRFNFNFTEHEKQALVAFLGAL